MCPRELTDKYGEDVAQEAIRRVKQYINSVAGGAVTEYHPRQGVVPGYITVNCPAA
jgi:hypothetical protein